VYTSADATQPSLTMPASSAWTAAGPKKPRKTTPREVVSTTFGARRCRTERRRTTGVSV
jgi:hypothetical protein